MLEIKNLSVCGKQQIPLLRNISFTLEQGQCLGLTGASGSGKTTLLKSVMGVLDDTCTITGGELLLDGEDLSMLSPSCRRALCGTTLGFVPQNPMTAFNRNMKMGTQLMETITARLGVSRHEAKVIAVENLEKVNLPDKERILNAYPPELTGGMLQRIAFSILLALNPSYILADEPTSALDEANRDILLRMFQKHTKETGILFISHDAAALHSLCGEIMVMQNGVIIERSEADSLFRYPRTEWTTDFVRYTSVQKGGDWEWSVS